MGRGDAWRRSHSRSPRRKWDPPKHVIERKDLPKAKLGQRWWGREDGRDTYAAVVPDLHVPVKDRGKIIGDRGSNVRKIVEVMCDVLGHSESKHGRKPFVQFNEHDGEVEFELELYEPFNNEKSFDLASLALREMVAEMSSEPFGPQSRHCHRPKKVQPDDWDCPNPKCGNLCFAKRWTCKLCGTAKPKNWSSAALHNNVPEKWSDPNQARPPKTQMELVTTKDRIGPVEAGQCQVVWLVPVQSRGYAFGKQGTIMQQIKDESGAEYLLTREVECRDVGGQTYCMAFLRGPQDSVHRARAMVEERAGGRLAEDGFEALLLAVENACQSAPMPIGQLVDMFEISDALDGVEDTLDAAGLASLLDLLEQFPERFCVRRGGMKGATVELPGAARHHPPDPPWKTRASERKSLRPWAPSSPRMRPQERKLPRPTPKFQPFAEPEDDAHWEGDAAEPEAWAEPEDGSHTQETQRKSTRKVFMPSSSTLQQDQEGGDDSNGTAWFADGAHGPNRDSPRW